MNYEFDLCTTNLQWTAKVRTLQYILTISWIFEGFNIYFINLFLLYYKKNNFLIISIEREKNKETFEMTDDSIGTPKKKPE